MASYGYCASKNETYYGFKGNLAIDSDGMSTRITVTPSNIDERALLWDIIGNIKVLVHTVGIMVNKMLGNPPLQFERLGIV